MLNWTLEQLFLLCLDPNVLTIEFLCPKWKLTSKVVWQAKLVSKVLGLLKRNWKASPLSSTRAKNILWNMVSYCFVFDWENIFFFGLNSFSSSISSHERWNEHLTLFLWIALRFCGYLIHHQLYQHLQSFSYVRSWSPCQKSHRGWPHNYAIHQDQPQSWFGCGHILPKRKRCR